MIDPCFVDANVLVHAHDPAEPLKCSVARELLQGLWADLRGRTSTQALNEFYVVVTRKLSARKSHDEAWVEVEEFFRWNPQPVDTALLQCARRVEARYKIGWWDCLIVAAAQLQGCSVLYTEDLQHGAVYDGVRVCNPFVTQVQEEPAPYRAQVVSPHRPRGRPRKATAV